MSTIKYVCIVLIVGNIQVGRLHMLFTVLESCYDPTETNKTFNSITGISAPQCGIMCARDERCKSISIKRDGNAVTCYHSSERRLLSTGCGTQYRHFNGYHSSCQYHGVFLNDTYGCRCYGGYIGAWCERLMEDCSEGASTDHYRDSPESDVFHIYPSNAPRAFKVVCLMPQGRTYLFKRRFDRPFVNFSRPWEDYRNGFGTFSTQGNFWNGLDMIHYVTNNRPHVMQIIVMFQEDGISVWRRHGYSGFQVSSEQHGYHFTFSSAVPPNTKEAVDGLSAFMGVGFSTYDRNDSCANIHQSGWWFITCDGYNPTGQPQPKSVQYKTSDPTQMSWPHPLNYSTFGMNMYVIAENN